MRSFLEDDYTAARWPSVDGDGGVSEAGTARRIIGFGWPGVDGAGSRGRGKKWHE